MDYASVQYETVLCAAKTGETVNDQTDCILMCIFPYMDLLRGYLSLLDVS